MGQRGAVATSQPLATLAGMEMLWGGGEGEMLLMFVVNTSVFPRAPERGTVSWVVREIALSQRRGPGAIPE